MRYPVGQVIFAHGERRLALFKQFVVGIDFGDILFPDFTAHQLFRVIGERSLMLGLFRAE